MKNELVIKDQKVSFSVHALDRYRTRVKQEKAITTFILDERWIEYEDYIKSISSDEDFFIVPLGKMGFLKTNRFNWNLDNPENIKTVTLASLQRAVRLRLLSKSKSNIFSLMLGFDKNVADAAAQYIPIESTHVVVSQNLLPFIWASGALGGRTFDVLMNRLPIEKLHQRLDLAHANHPESKTLNDFRAPESLVDLENTALTKSRSIITPHHEIADIFNNKSIRLNWQLPAEVTKTETHGNKILFPASALGRKGAYEIKKLAKELNLSIVVLGKAEEDLNFWKDVNIEMTGANPFEEIGLVVYPTYVEHQPRILLKAVAAGLSVITTTACGLVPGNNLTIVPIGDYKTLKEAVLHQLAMRSISKV